MKTTLKDIRRYVTTNVAEDLTKKNFSEIDAIRVAECGFETIAYSTGIYGVTAYWSRATPPASCTPSPPAPLRYSRLCDRGVQ